MGCCSSDENKEKEDKNFSNLDQDAAAPAATQITPAMSQHPPSKKSGKYVVGDPANRTEAHTADERRKHLTKPTPKRGAKNREGGEDAGECPPPPGGTLTQEPRNKQPVSASKRGTSADTAAAKPPAANTAAAAAPPAEPTPTTAPATKPPLAKPPLGVNPEPPHKKIAPQPAAAPPETPSPNSGSQPPVAAAAPPQSQPQQQEPPRPTVRPLPGGMILNEDPEEAARRAKIKQEDNLKPLVMNFEMDEEEKTKPPDEANGTEIQAAIDLFNTQWDSPQKGNEEHVKAAAAVEADFPNAAWFAKANGCPPTVRWAVKDGKLSVSIKPAEYDTGFEVTPEKVTYSTMSGDKRYCATLWFFHELQSVDASVHNHALHVRGTTSADKRWDQLIKANRLSYMDLNWIQRDIEDDDAEDVSSSADDPPIIIEFHDDSTTDSNAGADQSNPDSKEHSQLAPPAPKPAIEHQVPPPPQQPQALPNPAPTAPSDDTNAAVAAAPSASKGSMVPPHEDSDSDHDVVFTALPDETKAPIGLGVAVAPVTSSSSAVPQTDMTPPSPHSTQTPHESHVREYSSPEGGQLQHERGDVDGEMRMSSKAPKRT